MHQLKTRGERLHLGWLLKELVRDGLLTQADATSIAAKQRSADEAQLHPLDIIAARQCSHAQTSESLGIVVLCQWLATKVELEFVVLDPLKINVPVVTAEMSFAYAQRYGILCIQVHPTELVVAASEPFDLSWIESLEQTSKKPCAQCSPSPRRSKNIAWSSIHWPSLCLVLARPRPAFRWPTLSSCSRWAD